jgi:hypothetical protein
MEAARSRIISWLPAHHQRADDVQAFFGKQQAAAVAVQKRPR